MTRPASWLFLLSLALAGAVQAKKANVKEVCTTFSAEKKGTRTHHVADEVTTIIKHAKACTSTAKTVRTAKTTTLTSLVPTYTTETVTYPQETDVYTSTSWSFDFVFPTTTLTEASTPTVSAVTTVNNPDDITVFQTSYTLVAPLPTASRPAKRREHVRDLVEKRKTKSIKTGKPTHGALLGKDVYCHKEKTVTKTLDPLHPTIPCQTVTLTKKGPESTKVTKVPFTITVTSTIVPEDATRTVYETQESTVTAPYSTSSVTVDGPASTTFSTVTAAVATQTVVVPEYPMCKAENFGYEYSYSVSSVGVGISTASDAVSCCHTAASVPGAAFFIYLPAYGSCYSYYTQYLNTCPLAGITFGGTSNYIGGNLQCAS